LRIFAMSRFTREEGISTTSRETVLAFLILVSMSAMGSVVTIHIDLLHMRNCLAYSSPARLPHSRDLALGSKPAEAYPAHIEFSHICPRSSAYRTPVIVSYTVFFRFPLFFYEALFSQSYPPSIAGFN